MSKLDDIFKNAKRIHIDDNTKIVIMSDCHRGIGNNYDNFLKNQNIFEAALLHYYHNGFIYIELGDGDDMWEVDDYKDIVKGHTNAFKLLKKFNDDGRLIMVYGNHDMSKKSPKVLEETFYKYYDLENEKEEVLLKNLVVNEALILDYKNHDIFMLHGHQTDLLNSTFWRLSRFLVRNVWRTLEHIGIKDPTTAAKNHEITMAKEKKLEKWSKENNKILIAGHTHKPIFPKVGQSLYFNDGSCIHPNGITCLEIENGNITLVRWFYNIKDGNIITVGKEKIEKTEPIINYFKSYD